MSIIPNRNQCLCFVLVEKLNEKIKKKKTKTVKALKLTPYYVALLQLGLFCFSNGSSMP